MIDAPRSTTFAALGSSATVATTTAAGHDEAVEAARAEIASIDRAASRFREDSDISAVNRGAGRPVPVSELLIEAIEAGLRAAAATGGLVVPTTGRALRFLGYDRDFSAMAPDGPPLTLIAAPVPGWQAVQVDRTTRTVTVPAGVELDLGATAKALCSDRAARRAAAGSNARGVLVSLGGDIAVAGEPPAGGWSIGLTQDHSAPIDPSGPKVSIASGGLATSATTVRRWRRGERDLHHIIDPRTSQPADSRWAAVSVAAGTCVDANTASCAAVLLDGDAPDWLERMALPSRLVDHSGRVVCVAGWPVDRESVPV